MVPAAVLALAAGSIMLAAPSQAAGPAPAAKSVAGSHPSWATTAKDAGAAKASAQFTGTVYLAGRNPAGLAAYARAVSDPHSAQHGAFLSPAAYAERFGATKAQVAAVKAWLTGSGLTITGSTAHAITVKGDNAAVRKAFGTTVHQYRVKGALKHAPASNLVVPAHVSSAVLGVTGLTSVGTNVAHPFSHKAPQAAKPAGTTDPNAGCSEFWGQKTNKTAPTAYRTGPIPLLPCSYQPSQLRKAYGVSSSGPTGKGATVAIVDAYGSPTMQADANRFAANHGDKAFKSGQYTEDVDPSQWTDEDLCGGADGWAGEEALDVEMVHGLAPDAGVHYVGANSCQDSDLLAAITKIVDTHSADVITNSWGGVMHTTDGQDTTAAEIAAYTQVFQQAAAEGITINFSAGDCGDDSPAAAVTGANCQADTSRAQAQWPSASPWATSVGGTALALKDKTGTYGFETDMGNLLSGLSADGKHWSPLPGDFYFGGGGGTAEDFAQPWYQSWSVPTKLSHTLMTGAHSDSARRVTPDVAMNGDLGTAVLVGMTSGGEYSEGGYGGTSVSSPEFAAIQADAIQAQHHAIGFANPEIYVRGTLGLFKDVVDQAAATGQKPLAGITSSGHTLIAFGEDTQLNATRGYDDATGVGSPGAKYLKSFR